MKTKHILAIPIMMVALSSCDKLPFVESARSPEVMLHRKSEANFDAESMRLHVFNMFSPDKEKLISALKQMGNEYAIILADDLVIHNQSKSPPMSVTLTAHQQVSNVNLEIPKRRAQFILTREDGSTKIGVVTAIWQGERWVFHLGE